MSTSTLRPGRRAGVQLPTEIQDMIIYESFKLQFEPAHAADLSYDNAIAWMEQTCYVLGFFPVSVYRLLDDKQIRPFFYKWSEARMLYVIRDLRKLARGFKKQHRDVRKRWLCACDIVGFLRIELSHWTGRVPSKELCTQFNDLCRLLDDVHKAAILFDGTMRASWTPVEAKYQVTRKAVEACRDLGRYYRDNYRPDLEENPM